MGNPFETDQKNLEYARMLQSEFAQGDPTDKHRRRPRGGPSGRGGHRGSARASAASFGLGGRGAAPRGRAQGVLRGTQRGALRGALRGTPASGPSAISHSGNHSVTQRGIHPARGGPTRGRVMTGGQPPAAIQTSSAQNWQNTQPGSLAHIETDKFDQETLDWLSGSVPTQPTVESQPHGDICAVPVSSNGPNQAARSSHPSDAGQSSTENKDGKQRLQSSVEVKRSPAVQNAEHIPIASLASDKSVTKVVGYVPKATQPPANKANDAAAAMAVGVGSVLWAFNILQRGEDIPGVDTADLINLDIFGEVGSAPFKINDLSNEATGSAPGVLQSIIDSPLQSANLPSPMMPAEVCHCPPRTKPIIGLEGSRFNQGFLADSGRWNGIDLTKNTAATRRFAANVILLSHKDDCPVLNQARLDHPLEFGVDPATYGGQEIDTYQVTLATNREPEHRPSGKGKGLSGSMWA